MADDDDDDDDGAVKRTASTVNGIRYSAAP